MEYGARLINDLGQEMIVGNEKTWIFWRKYSGVATSEWTIDDYTDDQPPMGFIHNRNSGIGKTAQVGVSVYRSGSSWKISTVCTLVSTSKPTVDVYVFIPTPSNPNSEYGINIYNDASELAYHSGYKILRAEGLGKFWVNSKGATTTYDTGLSINKPAIAAGFMGKVVVPNNPNFGYVVLNYGQFINGVTSAPQSLYAMVSAGFVGTPWYGTPGDNWLPIIDAEKYD